MAGPCVQLPGAGATCQTAPLKLPLPAHRLLRSCNACGNVCPTGTIKCDGGKCDCGDGVVCGAMAGQTPGYCANLDTDPDK